jgi:hypothetical protein
MSEQTFGPITYVLAHVSCKPTYIIINIYIHYRKQSIFWWLKLFLMALTVAAEI